MTEIKNHMIQTHHNITEEYNKFIEDITYAKLIECKITDFNELKSLIEKLDININQYSNIKFNIKMLFYKCYESYDRFYKTSDVSSIEEIIFQEHLMHHILYPKLQELSKIINSIDVPNSITQVTIKHNYMKKDNINYDNINYYKFKKCAIEKIKFTMSTLEDDKYTSDISIEEKINDLKREIDNLEEIAYKIKNNIININNYYLKNINDYHILINKKLSNIVAFHDIEKYSIRILLMQEVYLSKFTNKPEEIMDMVFDIIIPYLPYLNKIDFEINPTINKRDFEMNQTIKKELMKVAEVIYNNQYFDSIKKELINLAKKDYSYTKLDSIIDRMTTYLYENSDEELLNPNGIEIYILKNDITNCIYHMIIKRIVSYINKQLQEYQANCIKEYILKVSKEFNTNNIFQILPLKIEKSYNIHIEKVTFELPLVKINMETLQQIYKPTEALDYIKKYKNKNIRYIEEFIKKYKNRNIKYTEEPMFLTKEEKQLINGDHKKLIDHIHHQALAEEKEFEKTEQIKEPINSNMQPVNDLEEPTHTFFDLLAHVLGFMI